MTCRRPIHRSSKVDSEQICRGKEESCGVPAEKNIGDATQGIDRKKEA